MFRFHSPYFLLLLIPLAILIFFLEYRRRPGAVLFSNVSLVKQLPKTFLQRLGRGVPWLFYLGTGLVIIASARPQSGKEEYRIRTEGIAMVMCIDRSGSMAAVDFLLNGERVTRLDAVKKTFRDFVTGNETLGGRPDDMIGLIAFGGYVDAFCPLTLDHDTLLEMLREVKLIEPTFDGQGRMLDPRLYEEENMTAIGDSLAQAVDRLKEIKTKSKVIILLSDGEQTFGTLTPLEGAETAKAFGIRIYSIGIGTTGMVPILAMGPGGQKRLVQQYMVIDESVLKNVAETTGGKYFNAQNTQSLRGVYEEIDKLEKTVHEGKVYTQYSEWFRIPLLVGLGGLVLNLVLTGTRFRRLP